ncbi:MAG: hypothetical protein L0H53_04580 [Candidatus Nitrosocosmicus sp.]|nr:hypothetical protein [Candidatus Nitrosocosmicus sp.]MDN5868341.1 hypothetical protein [Candidatus Nitrosocosmicus sp.]
MENKTIIVAVFAFAAILVSFSFCNAFAQNTTDMYPNDTETIQEFESIEGNNTAIFENDTSISNPANNLEESLSINENESN